MSEDFVFLMNLLSNSAIGTSAYETTGFESWENILRLSKEQSVYYLILHAMKRSNSCRLDNKRKAALFSELQIVAVSEFSKRLRIMRLLEDFDAIGIRVILLKGYAVASLYHSPDTRLSGDTDIYIDKKDENRAKRFLRQQGFSISPRDKRYHHSVCDHPILGHLELHTTFYDEITEKIWFKQIGEQEFIEEPYEKNTTSEGTYYSLGKTDNLIFLTLHMIKHFIRNGMSLRLIMDFALYYMTNEDKIDLARFWQTMEKLEYSYFVKIVLCISERFLHLSTKNMMDYDNVPMEDVVAILDDLEIGGWLGNNDRSCHSEGWVEYTRIKLVKKSGNVGYYFYMILWNFRGYIRALFPPRKMLVAQYPYLRRGILWLPIAWTHRIITRGFSYMCHGKMLSYIIKDEKQLNNSAQTRIALFRKIKII